MILSIKTCFEFCLELKKAPLQTLPAKNNRDQNHTSGNETQIKAARFVTKQRLTAGKQTYNKLCVTI